MPPSVQKSEMKSKATQFTCHASNAREVRLAGTFNGWSPTSTPLTKSANGQWTATLPLHPGRYEFKFLVDGVWCCEPGCDGPHHGCPNCVGNAQGTMNRVINVI